MEPKRTADDRWVQIEYNGEAITVPLSVAITPAFSPTCGRNLPTMNIVASGPRAQLKVRLLMSMMLK